MNTPSRFVGLPVAEFGSPGPPRESVLAAIRDGSKTATSSLLSEYEDGQHPLPWTGSRWAVIDSYERPVAVIEVTTVEVCSLGDVDMGHVVAEGEGHVSVAQWRRAREKAWSSHSPFIDDNTPVVLESFRLIPG